MGVNKVSLILSIIILTLVAYLVISREYQEGVCRITGPGGLALIKPDSKRLRGSGPLIDTIFNNFLYFL